MTLSYSEVQQIIVGFPQLSQMWDGKYIFKDCAEGFRHPWLNRLAENPDQEILTQLDKLDGYLGAINSTIGFPKLRPGLRARKIQLFSSTLAEVKTVAWMKGFNSLNEIHPNLSGLAKEADFSIKLGDKIVLGEVTQLGNLPQSWVYPGYLAVTDQKIEGPKRVRTLRQKGYTQLPLDVEGIWVAHIYHATLTILSFGENFLNVMQSQPNVLGVALWVRLGSDGGASLLGGVRCKELTGEGHNIYWLRNPSCGNLSLQQLLEQLLRC